MRKLTALILTAAALSAPSTALGQVVLSGPAPPTPAELSWAQTASLRFWKTSVASCGVPKVAMVTLDETIMGEADATTCTIWLNAALNWAASSAYTCTTYMHEFGHLLLGPTYFAAVNPADPAHSPDRTNIMYGQQLTPEEWESEQRHVGCIQPKPKRRHHHRHQH
jgi:hypothetical protein